MPIEFYVLPLLIIGLICAAVFVGYALSRTQDTVRFLVESRPQLSPFIPPSGIYTAICRGIEGDIQKDTFLRMDESGYCAKFSSGEDMIIGKAVGDSFEKDGNVYVKMRLCG